MTTIIDFQYHWEVWRCYKAVMSCHLEVNLQGYDSNVVLAPHPDMQWFSLGFSEEYQKYFHILSFF